MASAKTHKQAKRVPHTVPGLCCYVCGNPIKDLHTDVATLIQTVPEAKARHNVCAPGTDRWMKSPASEKSEIKQYYISNGEESMIMGEVPEKVKKAFPKKDPELAPEQRQLIGRTKYMAYMSTVLKQGHIDWIISGSESGILIDCKSGIVAIHDNKKGPVLTGIPEANSPEELRCYFLSLHDEKSRKDKDKLKVEGTITGRVTSDKPAAIEIERKEEKEPMATAKKKAAKKKATKKKAETPKAVPAPSGYQPSHEEEE